VPADQLPTPVRGLLRPLDMPPVPANQTYGPPPGPSPMQQLQQITQLAHRSDRLTQTASTAPVTQSTSKVTKSTKEATPSLDNPTTSIDTPLQLSGQDLLKPVSLQARTDSSARVATPIDGWVLTRGWHEPPTPRRARRQARVLWKALASLVRSDQGERTSNSGARVRLARICGFAE
jgi:hypothetical protein